MFQGDKLSIKQLLGLGEKTLIPQIILDRLNLGAQELEMLLNDQMIEIWNKPPQLSNLESAHYRAHMRIDLYQLKQALIEPNPEDRFIFVGEENKIKQLLPVDQLRRFEDVTLSSDNSRFIILDTGQEDEQFKKLCEEVDKANVEKKAGIVQPVLHLLQEEGEEWVWKQTYTRNFYIERCFYPVFVGKEVRELLLKPDSSDFIIFSGISSKEELWNVLKDKDQDKDNLKRNTFALLNEASAQKEFKRLSSNPGTRSIHWLKVNEVENKKQIQWHSSCGEVSRLRNKLMKGIINHTINEASLSKNKERIVVLADEPGMGKSTTLALIAEFIKKEGLKPWIIKIDLNRSQKLLSSKLVNTKEELVDLLFNIDRTSEKNLLAQKILTYQLDHPGQVVLLCDGFDEVKPEKQPGVLKFFKFLKKETAAKIWVTTRLHDKEMLENCLSVLAYTFEPLNKEKQIDFLSRFWTTTLKLTGRKPDPLILKGYAEQVIERFEQSIQTYKGGDKSFISIPLRARMLAEIFQEEVEEALTENRTTSEFFETDEKLVIGDVYKRFISKKYYVYLCEKIAVDEGLDKESQAILMKAYTKDYGLLAVKMLFNNQEIAPLVGNKKEKLSLNVLSRIGLVQGNDEPTNFIHRTFAEYFAAKWLAKHKENLAVKKFLGIQLFRKESSVIRSFFDYFLTKNLPLHSAVLKGDVLDFKELFNRSFDISETDSLGRTVLHMAAQEGRNEIIEYLWESDKLLADQFGKTSLHYAACLGHDEVVNQLLRNLTYIDLDDHIFRTPLHVETEIGNSLFNNQEYKKSIIVKLVNKRDKYGNPPLYYAANNEHWDVACSLLLHGADSCVLSRESKAKLLLFAADKTHAYANQYHRLRPVVGLLSIQVPEAVQGLDDYMYPRLLSYFFASGHTKVIDALLGSIQNFERRKRIANHVDNHLTPLRRITENSSFNDADHLQVVKYLFNQGVQHGIQIDSEAAGVALLISATKGNLNTFKYLVEQKGVPVNYSGHDKYTAIDRVLIENRQLRILSYLWENYRSSINDSFNRTPLHTAAFSANLQAIHYLCTHGAEIDAKDRGGKTPLHYAAQAPSVPISPVRNAKLSGHYKIVQYLIEEKRANFNIVDNYGKTALDLAIENEQWKVAEYLIKKNAQAYSYSLLTNMKRFFKSPNQNIYALHFAIRDKDIKSIRFLLQHQVDVNLIDPKGRTPLHFAAIVDWSDKAKTIEWLLQRGTRYDVLDNNQKAALDLLKENNSLFSRKSIWLLQLIDELFRSQNLIQDLQVKLLKERNEVKRIGPYGMWYPDVYDQDNPMQFILNARSLKRGTLLHVAANSGDLEALKCLLKFDQEYLKLKFKGEFLHARDYQAVDINARDEQGNTPLHLAAQKDHLEIVVLLLKEGAILNAKNNQKRTPKIIAKKVGNQSVTECLQQIEDLFIEVQGGYLLDIVDKNIREASVHTRDHDGKTLLHWAARQGHIEIVQELLDRGAGINVLDNQHSTPLHEAAARNQEEVIRLLLQQGAQFNIKDRQDKTPLNCLPNSNDSLLKSVDQLFSDIQSDRPDFVINLLQYFDNSSSELNAIVHARDERGCTLLHWAAQEHYSDILQQLLKSGIVYNAEDGNFKSHELFQLIEEWMYDKKPIKFSVEEVAQNSDKLTIINNVRDPSGKTPLHINTNYFRLKYLIEQGIDLTLQDREGNTPLHVAVERNDVAITKLLLDQVIDVNIRNNNGETALDIARRRGSQVLVALFSYNILQIQSNYKQQKAFSELSKFAINNIPYIEIQSVKQGLYLPSFEARNVKVNGKCVAITRSLSQALLFGNQQQFFNNLATSAEIYERIAQSKQISEREKEEIFALSKLLDSFEHSLNSSTSSLPSSLTYTKSYKTLNDLSHYIAEIKGDFAIHLVTSNHVIAIYRIGDVYSYFDTNVAFVSGLKSDDQLMQVVEKALEFAGYEAREKGFLIERFDVFKANKQLSNEDKHILVKEIKTERQLLAEQDKEFGLIKVNGQEISRVQLYNFGTKVSVEGSVPLLINAGMNLNSKNFSEYLNAGKVSITAREYLENLKDSKNTKKVIQATKSIPFIGSKREIEKAEQTRTPLLELAKETINVVLSVVFFANISRLKSQLARNSSKNLIII
ncbi:ankyrin repeat domain-containing protein [Wolbachia pipientis]|uniref:ankyrin repeat domain-containing protein n=1 Tax=Wolbachia pipientis TaxID=955 RepID=UPI0020B8A8B5|nr:ankyrin repeat domain-containing protein [Wolbachia pipientis]